MESHAPLRNRLPPTPFDEEISRNSVCRAGCPLKMARMFRYEPGPEHRSSILHMKHRALVYRWHRWSYSRNSCQSPIEQYLYRARPVREHEPGSHQSPIFHPPPCWPTPSSVVFSPS